MRKPSSSFLSHFLVRSAKKLLRDLTVSTIATLIVTASLSNLFFFASERPPAPLRNPLSSALIFSPIPAGPLNSTLEPVNIVAERVNTGLVREKLGRDQSGPHKPLRGLSKAIETAPMISPVQPPLQLAGANAAIIEEKLPPSGEASGNLKHGFSMGIILKPIYAIAGQLSSLVPKF